MPRIVRRPCCDEHTPRTRYLSGLNIVLVQMAGMEEIAGIRQSPANNPLLEFPQPGERVMYHSDHNVGRGLVEKCLRFDELPLANQQLALVVASPIGQP